MKRPKTVEGKYITLARIAVAQMSQQEIIEDKLKDTRRAIAREMHSVNVPSFSFTEYDDEADANRVFNVTLDRPLARRVNVRKLYTMLGEGEITLDEFFDCISAGYTATVETLGETRAKELLETYHKPLDLTIKES